MEVGPVAAQCFAGVLEANFTARMKALACARRVDLGNNGGRRRRIVGYRKTETHGHCCLAQSGEGSESACSMV